jgi:hypothetical protein
MGHHVPVENVETMLNGQRPDEDDMVFVHEATSGSSVPQTIQSAEGQPIQLIRLGNNARAGGANLEEWCPTQG